MKEETIKYWREHVERHRKSGLKHKEYCAKNELHERTFSNMKIKLAKLGFQPEKEFVEIKNFNIGNLEPITILFKGFKIIIKDNIEKERLKKIFCAMRESV